MTESGRISSCVGPSSIPGFLVSCLMNDNDLNLSRLLLKVTISHSMSRIGVIILTLYFLAAMTIPVFHYCVAEEFPCHLLWLATHGPDLAVLCIFAFMMSLPGFRSVKLRAFCSHLSVRCEYAMNIACVLPPRKFTTLQGALGCTHSVNMSQILVAPIDSIRCAGPL